MRACVCVSARARALSLSRALSRARALVSIGIYVNKNRNKSTLIKSDTTTHIMGKLILSMLVPKLGMRMSTVPGGSVKNPLISCGSPSEIATSFEQSVFQARPLGSNPSTRDG